MIVRLRPQGYPRVTGLVADIGGRRLFVPAEQVTDWTSDPLALATARLDLREFERREGEVLLRTDILGHRLIDTTTVRLVRAYDLELAPDLPGAGVERWVLVGVDTRPRVWRQRLAHALRPAPRTASGTAGVGVGLVGVRGADRAHPIGAGPRPTGRVAAAEDPADR